MQILTVKAHTHRKKGTETYQWGNCNWVNHVSAETVPQEVRFCGQKRAPKDVKQSD